MSENSSSVFSDEDSPVFTTASSVLASVFTNAILNGSLEAFTTATDSKLLTTPMPSEGGSILSANVTGVSTVAPSTTLPSVIMSTASTTLIGSGAGDICHGRWLPVNHLYFQLANVFLFLSYLAPNGIYGILYLRVTLCIGCFFFAIWGYLILCALDTFLWNIVFVVINFVHILFIAYSLRPIRFSNELEQVYKELFAPLRVSRAQYKRALDCMKLIRHVRFQEIYAQEKITRVDSLSLVLSGRLVISQHGKALHIVAQHQFLDSPEWFGVSSDEFFQVSATAIEDSRVLIWHRDKLKLSISNDPFLVSVFDHILGRDVVKKLMQVNETLSHQSLNGQCGGQVEVSGVQRGAILPAGTPVVAVDTLVDDHSFSNNCTSESKPLLVALSKTGEETTASITSILTKQIAELNSVDEDAAVDDDSAQLV